MFEISNTVEHIWRANDHDAIYKLCLISYRCK